MFAIKSVSGFVFVAGLREMLTSSADIIISTPLRLVAALKNESLELDR